VRDRRELEDEGRRQEDETEGDLVEVAKLSAARGKDEHHQGGDHADQRKDVHSRLAPEVGPVALLRRLQLLHERLRMFAWHLSVAADDIDECIAHAFAHRL
jgi:hypothetical protein